MAGVVTYFAWTDASEPFAESAHAINEELVFSFAIEHNEGNFPTLTIEIRNPEVGLLNPGRKLWAWLSEEDTDNPTDGIVPLFYGRLVGIPDALNGEVVTLKFLAKPTDYDAQRLVLAAALRVFPFYDPIFAPKERRFDPDFVLEGYPRLYHIHRVTHEVSTSDITLGEDGIYDFGGRIIYDSVNLTFGQRPATLVNVNAEFRWIQGGVGTVDLTDYVTAAFASAGSTRGAFLTSYTGGGLLSAWPVAGGDIGGGWAFGPCTCARADPTLIDSLNLHVAILTGGFSGSNDEAGVTSGLNPGVNVVVETGDDEEENGWIPSGPEFTSSWPIWENPDIATTNTLGSAGNDVGFPSIAGFPEWCLQHITSVDYRAEIQRIETLRFETFSSVQEITTDAADSTIDINFATAEVGQAIDGAQSIVVPTGDYFAIWPTRSLSWAFVTGLGGAMPFGLRQAVERAFSIWGMEAGFSFEQLGDESDQAQIILSWTPLGTGVFGLTTDAQPTVEDRFVQERIEFNSSETWTTELYQGVALHEIGHSIGLAHVTDPTSIMFPTTGVIYPNADDFATVVALYGATIPIGDLRRSSYLLTDRGRQSVEHLICRARVRLLARARAATLDFQPFYREVRDLSCRWSAVVSDPRLPGTDVSGKIVGYSLSLNGDSGAREANVKIACMIGKGESLTPVVGEPGWVDDGWVDVGWQTYSGAATVVAGDIQYELELLSAIAQPIDLLNMTPSTVVSSLAILDGAAAQEALLLGGNNTAGNAWLDTNQAVEALNAHMTQVAMALVPVVSHEPLVAEFDLFVSDLVVPRTIDLEAGSST